MNVIFFLSITWPRQALDLRTARQSIQAKACPLGYKRCILHTESGSSPRQGNSHIEHHGLVTTDNRGRSQSPASLLQLHFCDIQPSGIWQRHLRCRLPRGTQHAEIAHRSFKLILMVPADEGMKVTPGGSLWHDRFQLQHCCIILQNLKKGPVGHGGHAEKTSDPGQDDAVIAFQVIDSALCLLQALKTWHPCFLPISRRNLTVNRPWASKRFFHTLAKAAQGGQRNRKVSFYSNTGKRARHFTQQKWRKQSRELLEQRSIFSVLLVLQISKQTWNFYVYIYIYISLSLSLNMRIT